MSTRRVIFSRGTMLASSPPTGVKDGRGGLSPSTGTGGINVTMRFSVTIWPGLIAVATLSVVAGCGGGAPELEVSSQAEHEGVGDSRHDRPSVNFEIKTLSNRADLISDGDALVEVRVPRNVPMRKVTLTLNGTNVDAAFLADAEARTLRGVLRGLAVGHNRFVAEANGHGHDHDRGDDRDHDRGDDDDRDHDRGRPWASLRITNHPRGGPVILGSQTTPWICATPTPVAQSGNTPASNASGLTTFAVDAQCNIATEYKLFYRTTTA